MSVTVPDIARRAASRLATDFDPNLPALTERMLVQAGERDPRRSYDVAIGLAAASLLVSAVQFGWQIYRDLKAEREKSEALARDERLTRQVLVRRLRLSLTEPTGVTAEQRDRLLEVVAEEILAVEDLPD